MLTATKARAQSFRLGREKLKAAASVRREVARRVKVDEPKVVQALVSLAAVRIENATAEGNYRATIEVPSKSVGEQVIRALRTKGFVAYLHTDTHFTGVDEWEETLVVKISWS